MSIIVHKETTLMYGKEIVKIIIPKGNNAFYVSTWEEAIESEINNSEIELFLLLGSFTSIDEVCPQ